jgi:transcriptional regulator
MTHPFAPAQATDVAALCRAHPLAQIVSQSPDGFVSTPLPLLAEENGAGRVVSLLGHFALSNPQVAALRASPRALLIFAGPHGYIEPGWVSAPRWAPTWNYAQVEFETEIAFVPEENDRAVRALVAASEPTWTVDALGDRYQRMLRSIVAFRATVLFERARFKLGQDESDTSFAEIVTALGDSPLARLMRDQSRR